MALVALVCASSAISLLSPLSAQEAAAVTPSIAPTKFWNGTDGAACMVDVLRSRAPQFAYQTGTFQDFDVMFPTVEIASGGRLSRLTVISASEYMLRSASYPFSGFEPVLSGQHRYYYDLGSRDVPPSVIQVVLAAREEWQQRCGSFQWPLHAVGVCQCILRPEDFAMTGQLDLRTLLKPAPLTPVDIR